MTNIIQWAWNAFVWVFEAIRHESERRKEEEFQHKQQHEQKTAPVTVVVNFPSYPGMPQVMQEYLLQSGTSGSQVALPAPQQTLNSETREAIHNANQEMMAVQPLVTHDTSPPAIVEGKLRKVQEGLLETHLLDAATEEQEEMIRLVRVAFTDDQTYQTGLPPVTDLRKGWFYLGFSRSRGKKIYVLACVGTTAMNVQFRVWWKVSDVTPASHDTWEAVLMEGESQFSDVEGPFVDVPGHGVDRLVERLEQCASFL